MSEKLEWKYKDASRDWWRITAWKSGERPAAGLDDGSIDFEWSYTVEREDVEYIQVYSGGFVGQYDLKPDLQDLLQDFLSYIVNVTIGFSRYGDVD